LGFSVCPSRRSHARHRDRRNQTRNQRRQKESAVVRLSDSDTALSWKVANPAGVPKLLQFDTQLPVVTFTAVLQVYRASVDAPVHAVGGQICEGMKEADTSIHCIKLTPRQVEIYLSGC